MRMQMWMKKWHKMCVAMIGRIYGTKKVDEKVDVIIGTKKDANLDARQDAVRDVKVDENMGAIGETKLDVNTKWWMQK